VAGALKDGKIDEAIAIAEQNKRSHLAKVVTAGLQEFQAHQVSAEISGETSKPPSGLSNGLRPSCMPS